MKTTIKRITMRYVLPAVFVFLVTLAAFMLVCDAIVNAGVISAIMTSLDTVSDGLTKIETAGERAAGINRNFMIACFKDNFKGIDYSLCYVPYPDMIPGYGTLPDAAGRTIYNETGGYSTVFVPGYRKDNQFYPDNPLTIEKIKRGRRLFFDERLSVDNTVSCATCHNPVTAFIDSRDNGVGRAASLGDDGR